MPSAIAAALAVQAARAVDAVTAEAWVLVPMTEAADKNGAPLPDPSRAAVTFLATFSDREAKPESNSYDRRTQRRPGLVAGKTAVIVSPAAIADAAAAGQPLVIVQGDRLQRGAGGLWHVASVFPLPAGSLLLGVNAL